MLIGWMPSDDILFQADLLACRQPCSTFPTRCSA
jgi:hypothetical protein